MQAFTREELARFNGKDDSPAYFAYKGRVYDASASFLWRRGRHQVQHHAGVDYTGELETAPYGEDLLERVPVVGILVNG